RGDTLLHLVAALPHEESLCIGKLLLQEQDVHIDIQEHESGWTPLHKAIYYGNWGFAQALSSHSPDLTLRDREGLTPFDLLSLTLKDDLSRQHRSSQGVRKDPKMEYLKDNASGFPYTTPSTPSSRTTLYTWGSGANYNLGHADASDRIRPERVKLPQDPCLTPLSLDHPGLRPIKVIMGSRHSALITADPSDNLLTCGFGRGGRLGTGNETKMRFTPVKGISGRVTDVACGRDHTIVVTSCGTVWSFGSNAYESMQGATASITASVVWSRRHIYVFGQNQGHLG
ncbi:MAG: regulator of chromosome condensation 1/beta-lactamase-inhibitor protein II, partial [Piptocephalis tieghemiana]